MAILGKKPAAKPAGKPAPAAKPAAKPAAEKPAAPVKRGFPAKSTGAAKKTAVARPPKLLFDAPADMKPAFFEFEFTTGTDGLMIPESVQMARVKGKWDNADAPRFDMREYDAATLVATATRIAAVTFAPNVAKRLPANTAFLLIIRASKNSATNALNAAIRFGRHADASQAKLKWKWFEDPKQEVWGPVWRRLKRASRLLPSAFVSVQLPPSKRRKAADDSDE